MAEPLACAQRQAVLPFVRRNGNIDSINPEGKTKMKTSILAVTIVACALSASIVSAQERAAPATPGMSMDMNKQMPMMQDNMQRMQEQMEKIRSTTDPMERQGLMQKHMQAMQENMKAMRGMGGPMMMGGGQGGGMAMGDQKGGMAMGDKKGGMMGGDMMQHHQMMEKRMDMMQMMMEQMMQHDQMTEMPAR